MTITDNNLTDKTRPVKYSGPEFAAVAEPNTVLRGQVGSGLHGVTIPGYDDRDEMGICIEPPEFVIANKQLDGKPFEQYQYRTQPDGVRSGPNDLDLVIYGLKKWIKLATDGNPTVMLMMFMPTEEITIRTQFGHRIQTLAATDWIVSQAAAWRFLGYMESQRQKALGNRKNYTNRPELIDIHGFDTKFAYHMVRLGLQCLEFIHTGLITLPIPEPDRTWLLELRQGKHTLKDALDRAEDHENSIKAIIQSGHLRPEPDRAAVDKWTVDTYLSYWEQNGMLR